MSSTVAAAPLTVTRMENEQIVPITLTPSNDEDIKPPPTLARSRKRAASSEGSREDAKKQRGRPRVEPRDETAADRRRTQIRLAQRTYRARKESTISSLEDRVTHLENIIKDRNHGVHDLFQLAISTNLHNLSPPFFDALSKLNQSANTPSAGNYGEPQIAPFPPPPIGFVTEYSSSSGSDRQHASPPPPAHLSHESSFDEAIPVVSNSMAASSVGPGTMVGPVTSAPAARPMQTVWGYDFYYNGQEEAPPNSLPYGYPAYSDQFAGPATFGPIQQQQYLSQQMPSQHIAGPFASAPRIAMKIEPPLPQSYASREVSFSRYFHRKCLEYAMTILTDPARYEPTVKKVFATTLKHASIEAVQKRMTKRLRGSADDELDAPIDYKAPPDVDGEGHWLKPVEIEKFLTERGLVINLRQPTADCVTEDESILPGSLNPESLRNPAGAQRAPNQHHGQNQGGQIMIADPASYGSMPGFYGQTPLPPQWNQQYTGPPTWPVGCKRRRLTVDIASLMQFLVQASRCRGRTPAVRQQDLDNAFNRSVISVVPAC